MNNFTIKSFAPYSLNYLVYLQNAFIGHAGGVLKFPTFNTTQWGLLEERLFCDAFRQVWAEMAKRIARNSSADHNGILTTEQTLFQTLFKPGDQGKQGFAESRESFHAWFSSLAGQLTIELAADHIMYYQMDLYNQLSAAIIHDGKGNRELLISIIYDECVLGSSDCDSWHAVVSQHDIYIENKSFVTKIAGQLNRTDDGTR
ncbi:hypothetical protein [Paenibacillus sp. GCM10023250]|uniref:hypothetical protein n=1 Tax=Paenibacillus sp. GCM10023250 TaxID=3252648 RepID=UPI003614A359